MPMSPYVAELRAKMGKQLLQMPSVSGVVRDGSGRLMMARHVEGGIWAPPGGAIEPLETPAEAVVRELQEETGLTVEPERILGVFGGPDYVIQYGNGDRTSYVITVFQVRVVAGVPTPDDEETLEIGFFTEAEARAKRVPVWLPEILDAIFADAPAPAFRGTEE